ncbi:hypothetical protein FB381_1955 [Nocardioides albertanoniae]|uniref:Uncharacterized protein n=1 Tax=Nocardioides albertanoniae TaxID=1175486 RepID=A0A543A6F3_9ACTN|nr:hypothetical protein [Nocardioides albertanoniae]TQL68066.1 hypothetical protein FB381_1955 [Nocardioides albertanoniae]
MGHQELSTAPDLLEAQLFGLEETLRILREELTAVTPGERVHVARSIKETRLRIARVRVGLMIHGRGWS